MSGQRWARLRTRLPQDGIPGNFEELARKYEVREWELVGLDLVVVVPIGTATDLTRYLEEKGFSRVRLVVI